ncbi:hypothetical protein OUZ56_021162 [Daphnia magna]|uniref:Uncharacterized protein n=1 Tax=Daphnia magna TaxID=35525 RepID=A0ABQ9ZGL2_9CRUS|nr:hypothetical protein OUZ56_021162 [Daphnia magna]
MIGKCSSMYCCEIAVPTLFPVFTIHRLNIILNSSSLRFSIFVCAQSSVNHRFARSSHRFRFVASFPIVSSPSLSSPSSYLRPRLRHRLIDALAFAIVLSPPSPSSYCRPHLRHRLIGALAFAIVLSPPSPSPSSHHLFAFAVSPSLTMEQSDPEKTTHGDRA